MGLVIDDKTARWALGLGEAETEGESLGKAWREFARANHPDLRPNDPWACARFMRGRQAYELLCATPAGRTPPSPSPRSETHPRRRRIVPAAQAQARASSFVAPALPLREWMA